MDSLHKGAHAAFRALAAVLAFGAFGVAGCAQVGEIKASGPSRTPTQAYQQQDYKKAADLYEQAVQANPDLTRPISSSATATTTSGSRAARAKRPTTSCCRRRSTTTRRRPRSWRQSDKPEDKKLGKLSLEYLVAAYGTDKLNDPAKAEPVVQKMIQLDPTDPANYFALAKIYEDAGDYDEAEDDPADAKAAKPNDPAVYMQLAGLLQPSGRVRQDDRGARGARRRKSRTTPRRSTRSPPTTGTRRTATSG